MLNQVMSIKEASVRWKLDVTTIAKACRGQKGYRPIFNEDECNKSEGTWLVTYEAMIRVYGKEKSHR